MWRRLPRRRSGRLYGGRRAHLITECISHGLAGKVRTLRLAGKQVSLWAHGTLLRRRTHWRLEDDLLLLLLLKHALVQEIGCAVHSHPGLPHLGHRGQLSHGSACCLHGQLLLLLHPELRVVGSSPLRLWELAMYLRHHSLLLLLLPQKLTAVQLLQLRVVGMRRVHELPLCSKSRHALWSGLLRLLLRRHARSWHRLHCCHGLRCMHALLHLLLLRLVGVVLGGPLFDEGGHELWVRFEDVQHLLLLLGRAG